MEGFDLPSTSANPPSNPPVPTNPFDVVSSTNPPDLTSATISQSSLPNHNQETIQMFSGMEPSLNGTLNDPFISTSQPEKSPTISQLPTTSMPNSLPLNTTQYGGTESSLDPFASLLGNSPASPQIQAHELDNFAKAVSVSGLLQNTSSDSSFRIEPTPHLPIERKNSTLSETSDNSSTSTELSLNSQVSNGEVLNYA